MAQCGSHYLTTESAYPVDGGVDLGASESLNQFCVEFPGGEEQDVALQ